MAASHRRPPSATHTSRKTTFPSISRFTTTIVVLIGLVGGLLTILQFFGVTRLPLVSNFLHPGADMILNDARAVNFKDMSCTEKEVYMGALIVTSSGSCAYTSSPARALIDLGGSRVIVDVATNAEYQAAGANKWIKSSIDACQSGQVCVPSELESPAAFYDLTNVQFVRVESVDNQDIYHLKGSYPTSGASEGNKPHFEILSSTADLWISLDNFYPMRVVEFVNSASFQSHSTFDFVTYNQGITISLPSPDQIEPPGQPQG